jgi:pectate lyase
VALRKIGPLLLAALAVAGAATGLGGCHDVGLYLLRANPTDGGGGQGGVGVPTDGPTDVPVDMGNPIACSNDPMVGFATLGSITDAGVYHASTTGGGHQASTPVSTLGAFMTAVADDTPSVIVVSGLLQFASVPDGGTSQLVKVGSNKTIIGAANSGLVGGGLDLTGSANIIIRNLKISQVYHSDAIHLQYTQNVWIDHCDLSCDPSQPTACDDLIGISHASDLVTISWTWFHDHHDTTLIGHSDSTTATTEDATHLNVTLHHDLYSNISGGPRARIGYVHVFNLDFEQVDDYGVASTTMARVLVEGTFFNNVKKALTTTLSTSPDGYITEGIGDRMNVFAGTTPIPTYNTQVIVTSPNYPTPPLDQASRVPTLTQACAGVDKVDPMVNLP